MPAIETRIATLDDLEAVTKTFDEYRHFYGRPDRLDDRIKGTRPCELLVNPRQNDLCFRAVHA